MDPPETVLNFSEIRSPIKVAETSSKQPPPISNPQQNPGIPLTNSPHVISFNKADINHENPRARLAADALGQELHQQASIWQMYVEEAIEQDTELVEVQNKNLDLMLLFAALFSAILTAFLIESTTMLQQNPADTSAALLLFIAQSQRRIELGIPANALEPITNNEFSPSMVSRFINGLWFTSLALSLSAALIAMLAKEWLASYLATSVRPAHQRSRTRQARHDGLMAWGTLLIISCLPTLLHLSLLLFSLGLAAYLWQLDTGIAIVVAIITGLTAAFYAGTLICGAVFEPCPFVTQLSKYLNTALSSYIKDWKPLPFPSRAEMLVSHDSIEKIDLKALSWLAKNTHDPTVADCAYEAVAGYIALNHGAKGFTKPQQPTAPENSSDTSNKRYFDQYSPEGENMLFFVSVCSRLSKLIQQSPKAIKSPRGRSLARYAAVLPGLLHYIKNDMKIELGNSYIRNSKEHSDHDFRHSLEYYSLVALEDINLVFSDKWEPLSADEHALLSAAQLALTDVLISKTDPNSQSSSSQNPITPHPIRHVIEIDSGPPKFEALQSSCERAIARTSIQLRYHLNNQARISEMYLIPLLRAISAVLKLDQVQAGTKHTILVVGAAKETHLPPGNDNSQLSSNTLVVTLLKMILDEKATQLREFFPAAAPALTLAASPYFKDSPMSSKLTLGQEFWNKLDSSPQINLRASVLQFPLVYAQNIIDDNFLIEESKVQITRQALAISTLSFTTYDWLPVAALRALLWMINNRLWDRNEIELNNGLIEKWIREGYKLHFNQTTKQHKELAKEAHFNLIGIMGQAVLLGQENDSLSTSHWKIEWESCLVPLLTIISITPNQAKEVGAILQYLVDQDGRAFPSMLKLLRGPKGFSMLWAIRHHSGYATAVSAALNALLETSQLDISEDNVQGFLEEVYSVFEDKTFPVSRTTFIKHVIEHLDVSHNKGIELPWDHYALEEARKPLEGDSTNEAKVLLDRLKSRQANYTSPTTDNDKAVAITN